MSSSSERDVPLLVAEGLLKRFEHEGSRVEVLRGVDLRVESGEMVCVVGPSGAGKSTLLHILGTLDLPTAGSVRYEGQEVTRFSSRRLAAFRNRTLGFVFQFHHLLPEFSALENVMMPGLVRGMPRRRVQERALALLEEVGLSHRLSHRPGELSGGEQQRVALARALVMEPKLLLADEPTGNLDSTTSEAIHDLLFRLNAERGTTVLLVTHDRDLASRMPRVVHMRDGRIERDERRGGRQGSGSEPVSEPLCAEASVGASPAGAPAAEAFPGEGPAEEVRLISGHADS